MSRSPSPAAEAWTVERDRLVGIAYRMLGDYGDAEDVVSEVAIEAVAAERSSEQAVRSWPAWLTTACVRRSIDRLRQRHRQREDYVGPWLPEPVATERLPEDVVASRQLLSLAVLHLAEQLAPDARAAIVLHRAFAMTASEIAPILGRSPAAVRQLISRGERRLGSPEPASASVGSGAVIRQLVSAIETGDITTVVSLLEYDAILWTDGGGRVRSALNPIFGAERIVRFLVGVLFAQDAVRPVAPRFRLLAANGEELVEIVHSGRRDVVHVDVAPSGRVRGLRQVSNPIKLMRV
ncbi:sigma-70 family RNA polymerase sigma factor [Microbacterium album]|uniref:sigma-70 family RNA polymerase sigma factor n=1 Tax=Microbacterium album TaxID=2053191 RepID=UPI001E289031|nr:sigma-70 family RNA polymerase sigma factor [Microbacterium album]